MKYLFHQSVNSILYTYMTFGQVKHKLRYEKMNVQFQN